MSVDTDNTSRFSTDVWIAVALFGAALAIRLIRLFDLDVWFDEVVLLLTIKHGFAGIWNTVKADNFPPLYPWLMKLWATLFPGENALRVFAALTGSLTPPAAYFLGKELMNRKMGILLGIACVFSYALIFYSQMIRMYSLFPFWACLSLIGFVRGLKTNSWKAWISVAVANLLGFYTFLFMIFLIGFEFLLLLWHFRADLKRFLRPLYVHLPVFVLMLLWIVPLVQRLMAIEESFILSPVTPADLVKLWVFLGTGTYFGDHYTVAALLNLPFLFGFLFAVIKLWKNLYMRYSLLILILTVVSVYGLSMCGQSIFLKRYFLFLLPVYLALVLAGCSALNKPFWRRLALSLTFLALLISSGYYYADYYNEHEAYGFCLTPRRGVADGHSISKISRLIENKIGPDGAIIHFSNPSYRNLSFFPAIYYHHRSLPEYLYSKTGLHQWSGAQYLLPGEHLTALFDLDPLPDSIWLVTLDPAEHLFDRDVIAGRNDPFRWVAADNLPKELVNAGYHILKIYQYGNASAIHLRRSMSQIGSE